MSEGHIEVYEMLQKWIPMVQAAGLYNAQHHTPFDCYLLAGHIMHDPVVSAKAAVYGMEHQRAFATMNDEQLQAQLAQTSFDAAYISALHSLTVLEKKQLRERIVAALRPSAPLRKTP